MSLDTVGFKANLKALYTDSQNGTENAADNLDAFLNALVAATATFIKSAEINYTTGLTANGSPVEGVFGGTLS